MSGSSEEGRSRSLSPPRERLSRRRSRSLSLSPPPSPSPPQEKAEKMRSLWMFFDHGLWDIRLSLCRVEISIPKSVDSLACPVRPIPIRIVPTLLFHATDFPARMRCVHLDSKFYFLGGEISLECDESDDLYGRDQLYPPDVYIFDPKAKATATATATPNDAKDFVTPGPRMKTGKPSRFYLFVTYGKIYALSTPTPLMVCLSGLDYFEVFDPKTNHWDSLPPPPSNTNTNSYELQAHALLNTKLYFMSGLDVYSPSGQFNLYCFDLNNNQWEPSVPLLSSQLISLNLHHRPRLHLTYLMPDIVDDSLHGFGFLNSSLVSLGPPVKPTEGECFNYLMHLFPLPLWNPWGQFLDLGNSRFCYVECVNPEIRLLLSRDAFDIEYDSTTLYINLTIFELPQDGHICSKAKLLHPAFFVAKFPEDINVASLAYTYCCK